jgi:integrase
VHELRRRFRAKAYRGSRNMRAAQALLGQADVATTERYTAVDDEIRAAAGRAMRLIARFRGRALGRYVLNSRGG